MKSDEDKNKLGSGWKPITAISSEIPSKDFSNLQKAMHRKYAIEMAVSVEGDDWGDLDFDEIPILEVPPTEEPIRVLSWGDAKIRSVDLVHPACSESRDELYLLAPKCREVLEACRSSRMTISSFTLMPAITQDGMFFFWAVADNRDRDPSLEGLRMFRFQAARGWIVLRFDEKKEKYSYERYSDMLSIGLFGAHLEPEEHAGIDTHSLLFKALNSRFVDDENDLAMKAILTSV